MLFRSRRTFAEFQLLRKVIRTTRPSMVVCLAITPATLVALRVMWELGIYRGPVSVVVHGVLSETMASRRRNPLAALFQLRSAIYLSPGSTRIVVLDPSIIETLRERQDALASRLECIALPMPLDLTVRGFKREESAPVKVGFLGFANDAKGFREFVMLAEETVRNPASSIEFHAIGSYEPGYSPPDDRVLRSRPSSTPLVREDYVTRLQEIDYACLPLRSHYSLAASGTLLDAIGAGKPVICLTSAATRSLFAEGSPGYLCADLAQMQDVLRALATEARADAYERQVLAMCNAREHRSLERSVAALGRLWN